MAVISVIVPVYNAEKYLNRCIDSILDQTFKNFELILVDDGSKDRSGDICERYAEQDQRIKVIHQENKGQAAARNRGVINAFGEWIAFVDADDMIQQQMLEYLYRAVISTNTKIAACKLIERNECPADFDQKQNCDCISIRLDEKKMLQWCTAMNLDVVDKYAYWIACAKLVHKSIVKALPFKEGRIYEDNALVFKWLFSAGSIAVCDNVMYFYRVNNNGTTKGNYSICKLDWLWALEEQIKFYKKVKFLKMVDALVTRFIRDAMCEYENIQKYLQDKKQAEKLRRRIIRFWILERKFVCISRKETLDIFTRLYPRQMHFLWSAKKKIVK